MQSFSVEAANHLYNFSYYQCKPFHQKIIFMRRYLQSSVSVLLAAMLWTSCDKKDNNDNNTSPAEDTYKLSGTASGANERPNPVTSNGTATLTGTYHTENKMLDYTITWSGLSANAAAMHFHGPAGVDSAAGVQIPIVGFAQATSGSIPGMEILKPEQESELLNGKMYYNIHTANFPGGEIRGQVSAKHD
jgi:hypothetical protein